MKSKKILTAFLLLFTTLFITSYAQTKTITIIQNSDSMKVMTIMSDSLQKSANTYTYTFSSDDVVSGNSEINEIKVQVDTLDDGKIVKEIIITSSGDSSSAMHKGKRLMMILEDNIDDEFVWHTAKASAPREVLSPVAISELHLLKKAGFSANALTSEPLEFKKLGINIEHEKTSDSDILKLNMNIALPEKEKVTVTLIDKIGTKIEEEEYRDTDKVKIKYKLNKDSAPYYIIVLQDKRIWSRKVDF